MKKRGNRDPDLFRRYVPQWKDLRDLEPGQTGGNSRLVVRNGDGNHRHSFHKCFQNSIGSRMSDDNGRPLQYFKLRSIAYDQRSARQAGKVFWGKSSAERDHQLRIDTAAGFGDHVEECWLNISCSS